MITTEVNTIRQKIDKRKGGPFSALEIDDICIGCRQFHTLFSHGTQAIRQTSTRLYHPHSSSLTMTVRSKIAKPRRENGARNPEDLRHTRAVRRKYEGRARRP